MTYKKKLIEVALPLDAINKASAREKSIRHGHPSTLHLWWARRPLAAARAVIFAQMVDDPSAHPDLFPTEKAQEKERQRLFRIIEDLVKWENTTNEEVLQQARDEIWQSWRYTCAENADHPMAKELFNRYKLPPFHDPFAGGGSLPLEAQRLGLEAHASDLNPVAVLINKAMIEIPSRFSGKPPINPEINKEKRLLDQTWPGSQGLAEDVDYYGRWIRDEAKKRIGSLYPEFEITSEIIKERPDLEPYVGRKLVVIAWIWARTVKSPNPAFSNIEVPLASTFMLSTKKGKEAYIVPIIQDGNYQFTVKISNSSYLKSAKNGTKLSRGANFQCIMSGTPITGDYIKAEGKAGGIGSRMMAVVAEGPSGRIYLPPTPSMEAIAYGVKPNWIPDIDLVGKCRDQLPLYGINTYDRIFTLRQLVTIETLLDLVQEVRVLVKQDAIARGIIDDGEPLANGGTSATAYADAIALYLGLGISKNTHYWCSFATWHSSGEKMQGVFARQAIPMVWDFAESNPLCDSSGSLIGAIRWNVKVLEKLPRTNIMCISEQRNAASRYSDVENSVISTDPPYYDNICYADLSDFFYIWLRYSMQPIFPDLFTTLVVPKADELIASPYRHSSKKEAEAFFLDGMTQAMQNLVRNSHPAFPVTIYYAFKQSENDSGGGIASTGWVTFLEAVIKAGFSITGTWPIRTEMKARSLNREGTNALASSIVLVCRKAVADAPSVTRRDFLSALNTELPNALSHLQASNIAPVDLAQAAIGPGMAIYTRYNMVIDAQGQKLTVRQALTLINQVLDEVLAEQEGDFDADTRWALAWFEQTGFKEGEFGVAEILSKAKDTSVEGMVEAGILMAGRGKVRLLRPYELVDEWNPHTEKRLTVWGMVHHLIRALETGGESAAAELLALLGAKAETARELCYRLYTICERKKRATEALSYNALVQSWPEITRLAREISQRRPTQSSFLE